MRNLVSQPGRVRHDGPMTDGVLEYLFESAEFEDFGSWTARLALRVLIEDALNEDDIAKALVDERLRRKDGRRALLLDDSLSARIRIEQDRLVRAGLEGSRPVSRFGSLRAGQYFWLATMAGLGVGYVSLLRFAWPRLPLPWQVVAVLGLVAVFALSVRTLVRRVPGVFGMADGQEIGAFQPHPDLLCIGDRGGYLLAEIVVPAVQEFIRARRSVHHGTKLVYTEVAGLYEVDGGKVVVTAGAERLRRIIERADSGAVALAGSRGVGKTTAIEAMRQGRLNNVGSPPLVVMASAPSNYEARDFVLHMHALLCRTVIDKVSEALRPLLPRSKDERWAAVRQAAVELASFFTFAIVCLGAALLLWGVGLPQFPVEVGTVVIAAVADLPVSAQMLWNSQPLNHLLALGAVALVAWRVAWAVVLAPLRLVVLFSRRHRHRDLFDLHRFAVQQLAQTRFLQTHTTGWSGKLSLPLKGEAGRTWSMQRAEQQLTHPEVVEKLRSFAEESSRTLRDNHIIDRMVIAIDELDKIGEPEKAQQFINDIKGVFGVAGCLFFVSVSDDAVLNFEQRGLGIRDAFDSAFSEMVRLEHFTLDESRLWVALRITGVTEQFCYLCHCLSGGLPRDLQRYTIEMVDVSTMVYEPRLSAVTETLVRNDLSTKIHALTSVTSTLEATSEHVALTAKLLAIRETTNPLELARLADDLVREAAEDLVKPTDDLRWNAGCFTLFCATVLDVFDDDLGSEELTTELHQLALARRQMATHPQLAWRRILDFRKDHNLDPIVRPEV
jgi:hypothetical protein